MVDFFFSSAIYQLTENNIVKHILNDLEMFVSDCQSFSLSKKRRLYGFTHGLLNSGFIRSDGHIN